jgi:hypothetical protein
VIILRDGAQSRYRLIIFQFLASKYRLSLKAFLDHIVKPSAHVLVEEVRTSLRVSLLLSRLVVEVDTLVVYQIAAILRWGRRFLLRLLAPIFFSKSLIVSQTPILLLMHIVI